MILVTILLSIFRWWYSIEGVFLVLLLQDIFWLGFSKGVVVV